MYNEIYNMKLCSEFLECGLKLYLPIKEYGEYFSSFWKIVISLFVTLKYVHLYYVLILYLFTAGCWEKQDC